MISQQSTNKRTDESNTALDVKRFNLHKHKELKGSSVSQIDREEAISPRFPDQITPIREKNLEQITFKSAKEITPVKRFGQGGADEETPMRLDQIEEQEVPHDDAESVN